MRQEFVPLSGKYVDLLKVEPLHSTNNAWQIWFSATVSVVMQYTNQSHLKAETIVSELPDSSPLLAVLKCLKDKVKYGRLHKAFLRWFTEKQKKGITFSYGFTRLESKYILLAFCLFDIGTSEDQLSFKGVSCETSHWHLLSSNSETQFLFTQQSRCTLSKWKS